TGGLESVGYYSPAAIYNNSNNNKLHSPGARRGRKGICWMVLSLKNIHLGLTMSQKDKKKNIESNNYITGSRIGSLEYNLKAIGKAVQRVNKLIFMAGKTFFLKKYLTSLS